jgi:hypothetical protein
LNKQVETGHALSNTTSLDEFYKLTTGTEATTGNVLVGKDNKLYVRAGTQWYYVVA